MRQGSKGRWIPILFVVAVICAGAVGICIFTQKRQENAEEKKELAFSICEEEQLPDELKERIEERKEEPFQLTFQNSANLYIVVGYGEQPRGEYVAAVRELYETERGIYVDTTLISISYAKEQQAGEPSTYPYVVLKCDPQEKRVFFL
jgi:hypothetical protein